MKRGMRERILSRGMMLTTLGIILGILLFAAPITPATAADGPKINVMTRNLYLGADIFRVADAASNPSSVPDVVAEVYQIMLETNFPARAEAIADEIASNKPQVIGLNEVETFIKFNSYFQLTELIDFYTILNAALEARGMYYQAFSVTNANVIMPMTDSNDPNGLSWVNMIDHDYILVRKGNTANPVCSDTYNKYLSMPIGTATVDFKRGYLVVDVNVKGEDYRIACTHLEVRSDTYSPFRLYQAAQMSELLGALDTLSSGDPKPLIIVGDLNSSPDDIPGYAYDLYNDFGGGWQYYEPPYMQTADAEYLDTWLLQSKYDEGYTSGFDEFVSDPYAELDTRIDLIFLKPFDLSLDKVSCDVVGDEETDMVYNTYPDPIYAGDYLWPSDHAGVVAKIKFLP